MKDEQGRTYMPTPYGPFYGVDAWIPTTGDGVRCEWPGMDDPPKPPELKPVTITIAGRPVVVQPMKDWPPGARDLWVDWSRWDFSPPTPPLLELRTLVRLK